MVGASPNPSLHQAQDGAQDGAGQTVRCMHESTASAYRRIELVGQRLEEDGGGGDLLAAGGVVAVRQVPAAGQVQPHDAVVGLQQRRVDREVGWTVAHQSTGSAPEAWLNAYAPLTCTGRRDRCTCLTNAASFAAALAASRRDNAAAAPAGVGLHVHAPGRRVEAVRLQGARLAQVFHAVDVLVAAVVARPRLPLAVLVGHAAAQRLHHRRRREVLRGDELDALPAQQPPARMTVSLYYLRALRAASFCCMARGS